MVEKNPSDFGSRRQSAGPAKRSFTPFSVTLSLYCLPFRKGREQRRSLGDDSTSCRRSGKAVTTRWKVGRKGGRNKSSASNRGRASARFYSRTLNSIAIGFSDAVCRVRYSTGIPIVSFSHHSLSMYSTPSLSLVSPSFDLSVTLLVHLYCGGETTSVVSYTGKPYY